MLTQVMTAACGVTINCARCHDHKLDPISQREYYGLSAVFAGVKRGERDVSTIEVRDLAARKQSLNAELQEVRTKQARLSGRHFDLADIVGGGDGLGTGKLGEGIDPITGKPQSAKRELLEGAKLRKLFRQFLNEQCMTFIQENCWRVPLTTCTAPPVRWATSFMIA